MCLSGGKTTLRIATYRTLHPLCGQGAVEQVRQGGGGPLGRGMVFFSKSKSKDKKQMAAAVAETAETAETAQTAEKAPPQAEAATEAKPASPKRKPSKKAAAQEKAAQEALDQSAVKMQAAMRGAEGRRKSAAAKADKEEQVNAATKVQAIMRGNSTRKNTPGAAGKTGKSSFSDDFAEYLTKVSDWWKTDVVEGKTMTKVRGLPCLAVRGQDN